MFNGLLTVYRQGKAKRLLNNKKYKLALEVIEQAHANDKNKFFPWIYFETKGIALYYLGRYEEAIKAFENAFEEVGPMLKDKEVGGSAFSVLQKSSWYMKKAENRINAHKNT